MKRNGRVTHLSFTEGEMNMEILTIRFQKILTVTALACLCLALSLHARPSKKPKSGGVFSYYMLVLSYAPDFCAEPGGNKDPKECGTGRHIGFVVHGLWPQSDTGRGPENCGSVSPVGQDIVSATLSYIPTASLIQHEWKAHGSCSGLDSASYFALVRKARDSVTIPDALSQPGQQIQISPGDIESKMAGANSSIPQDAFTVSCYHDNNLQEVRICFNKDLSPRACTASAGHCDAKTVTLQPVR
jgi:ribonuclease T2